jgi:c(7)-type cytochrome triheme protein
MFIAKLPTPRPKLRRSELFSMTARVQRTSDMWLLRSLRPVSESVVHKHLVPTGLIVLAFGVIIVCANCDVHVSAFGSPTTGSTEPQESPADFSRFKHDNPNHTRLPCLLCHRRDTNSPRPTMPGGSGHLPCAGCHAQQFANSGSPICTVCHTDAQSGALKPFPRLTDFRMKFDHAPHLRMNGLSCATCHRSSRGGVSLSIPRGFNAHVTCYQCHSPRAKSGDRDISSCGVCHEMGGYARANEMVQAFLVGFSHAMHGKSAALTCNECHRLRAGTPWRIQVSSPQPLNHHASNRVLSCASCHNGQRVFGGDDFSVCKRCHNRNTWHF